MDKGKAVAAAALKRARMIDTMATTGEAGTDPGGLCLVCSSALGRVRQGIRAPAPAATLN